MLRPSWQVQVLLKIKEVKQSCTLNEVYFTALFTKNHCLHLHYLEDFNLLTLAKFIQFSREFSIVKKKINSQYLNMLQQKSQGETFSGTFRTAKFKVLLATCSLILMTARRKGGEGQEDETGLTENNMHSLVELPCI